MSETTVEVSQEISEIVNESSRLEIPGTLETIASQWGIESVTEHEMAEVECQINNEGDP